MKYTDFNSGARAMQDAALITINTIDTENMTPIEIKHAIYSEISKLTVNDAAYCGNRKTLDHTPQH